ncbi:hypothetical protein [Streptomyces europaeiscabiei]
MTIDIQKVTAHIGARVSGVDISEPLDEETVPPCARPSTSTGRSSSTT